MGEVVVAVKEGANILIGTLDPRAASYQQSGVIPPFLDYYEQVTVINNTFILPEHLRDLTLLDSVRCAQVSGALSGEPIGIDNINTTTWVVTTARSFPAGNLAGWLEV